MKWVVVSLGLCYGSYLLNGVSSRSTLNYKFSWPYKSSTRKLPFFNHLCLSTKGCQGQITQWQSGEPRGGEEILVFDWPKLVFSDAAIKRKGRVMFVLLRG
ncbi:hypothetical protein CDAR_565251 [Caerostris darwini]|uniref:Secreted protein n=1 Tax=Caerostris darwini TaxID=1538125 RepID=A0AAV4TX56_9ARAC|nr:hypothetical protein CDAR_565251 [Caerostris darwini]